MCIEQNFQFGLIKILKTLIHRLQVKLVKINVCHSLMTVNIMCTPKTFIKNFEKNSY